MRSPFAGTMEYLQQYWAQSKKLVVRREGIHLSTGTHPGDILLDKVDYLHLPPFAAILKSGPSAIAAKYRCFQNEGGKCLWPLRWSCTAPKLHSCEVGRIPFDRTLHQALSCSRFIDTIESQSLRCPDRTKLQFPNNSS